MLKKSESASDEYIIQQLRLGHGESLHSHNEDIGTIVDINPARLQGTFSPNNTAINVKRSKGVNIGPVTNFNGNVTILHNTPSTNRQNVFANGNEPPHVNRARHIGTEAATNSKPTETTTTEAKIKKCLSVFYLLAGFIIVSTGVGIVILLLDLNQDDILASASKDSHPDIAPAEPESSIAFEKTPSGHKYIYRDYWGGRPPLKIRPLAHPTKVVLITHTAGQICTTMSVCASKLQTIQSYHVAKGSPDIGSNFLIGSDGNIYVGRGWDVVNYHDDGTISVAFIGNYVYDTLTPGQIEAAQELLELGVNTGKLARDYHLVAHNQTSATDSPGGNVYKVISTWQHFSVNY